MWVTSGVDRHLDITFGLHVIDSSSLVYVLFIPTSPFFVY